MRSAAVAAAASLILGGCSAGVTSSFDPPRPIPKPLQLIIGHPDAPTDDTIEVSICVVPPETTDPIFGDLPLRLTLDPTVIARQMESGVRPYFEALSHGLYHPHFIAGEVLAMKCGW